MTSNQNDPATEAEQNNPNAIVIMRHPDLGDDLKVPTFAVPLREEMGYERVPDAEPDASAEITTEQAQQPSPLPAPTGATTTRATTSGTAKSPSPDGGQPAATPAD